MNPAIGGDDVLLPVNGIDLKDYLTRLEKSLIEQALQEMFRLSHFNLNGCNMVSQGVMFSPLAPQARRG